MFLWVLFVLCIIIEIIFVPLFLKAQWPNRSIKSLTFKMICSTAFLSIGIISVFIAQNKSTYALMMVSGLALGWIGDFFLHSKSNQKCFAVGFIGFLLGHVVYIAAYLRTIPLIVEDYKIITLPEIVAIFALMMLSVLFVIKFKDGLSMPILKIAVIVYSLFLIIMFIKASALGYGCWTSGVENGVIVFIILSLGSLLFLLSDATLGLLMFGGQKGNKPLKVFNIVTYYLAQVLLASSILFINA